MSDKLKDYYNDFLKKAIKSPEQLNSFMKKDDIRKKFTSNEIKKLKSLWSNTPVEAIVELTLSQVEEIIDNLPVVDEETETPVRNPYSKRKKK